VREIERLRLGQILQPQAHGRVRCRKVHGEADPIDRWLPVRLGSWRPPG
jgi:hypothetical protein